MNDLFLFNTDPYLHPNQSSKNLRNGLVHRQRTEESGRLFTAIVDLLKGGEPSLRREKEISNKLFLLSIIFDIKLCFKEKSC